MNHLDKDNIENAIKSLEEFIEKINDFSDDYNINTESIDDIYDILQSDLAELIIYDYDKLKNLIKYQKNISIKIINSITYEDICDIIKEYVIVPHKLNVESLEHTITSNLIKINTNLVLQQIYKTAPRLILNSEEALFDIIFEEETAKKKLNETIQYIKKKIHKK